VGGPRLRSRAVIEIERRGNVAVVHLRDGENRFNGTSIERWHAVLDELEATEGPLAVVTTGEGRFYSNGLDLDWMGTNPDAAGGLISGVHRLLGRVLGFDAITIAALNGHAFAGGAMLATAHDFAIMRDDRGYWCLPEVDLGLPLTPAMHAVITARLPRVTAHEAMMTGRRYTAAEALGAGIVGRIAPEADVVPQAIAWAEELAGKDRAVIAAHKQLTYGAAISVCEGHLPGGPEAA
jgi:Delta3-Delta2-enoyl-CoA isomerase